ncbi:V-set and immunoglobulin domain-containing protein 4 isoform X2 [Sarcophilus harrisii]|uniref:V-set and immunoglobulin domain-containing protein 4 isoform X2 n=1 Tax=Sarcophilus harrisii TaxID=9305 RepID=UPI001301C3D8|nr:V-set and immunoglobulin domain-containing protein 4 isoform X2 [Sarcophilus harrisii]
MFAMALFLEMVLLAHLLVHLNAVPMLEGPKKLIGPWKGSVNITCTYRPMEGYSQHQVKWLIRQNNDPVTIFVRDGTGDHIQQTKYRGRLEVTKDTPGDVSLVLDNLEMDDRGEYVCQVTWKTADGGQLMREHMTELQIQKLPVSKPLVTTGSGYGFKVPHGMRISLLCRARGSPPITYKWYKGTPDGTPTQVTSLGTLLFKPAQVSDSGIYFCVAKARVGPEQMSDPVHFVVTESSKRPTTQMQPGKLTATTPYPEVLRPSSPEPPARDQTWTPGSFSETSAARPATHPATPDTSPGKQATMETSHAGGRSEGPGPTSRATWRDQGNVDKRTAQGLPLYAIILITLVCIVLVFAIAFGLCRRRSQEGHIYEVARMSTGDGPRVSIYSGGPSQAATKPRALENEYHSDPSGTQDYQIITQANSDYARLLGGNNSAELEMQDNRKPNR